MSELPLPLFSDLNLSEPLLRVLKEVGYESPSPIQAATIPILLANRDVLGQAQTGTGKTAAFALPILSRIDIRQTTPQALVLAPTRELAIQVAEAFQRYAAHIPGFHVLPIYGGQSYEPQLRALRRGVHVVVGTPGRVIDHLDKNTLDLSQLKTLVLDEADEMLRMGFIDDVENILKKTPATRQTALFSATMPSVIRRIAKTYLRDPSEIAIAAKTGTADNIRQRYWLVSGMQKLEALTRILEAETFDGMIIFSRTKLGTEELASKLQARGFSAAAINGDIQQAQRERTIQQLKDGRIDILVATDVAARGLDVERISHVVNYDVPHDPESYTHRVGRTGRAGRSGEAILFITPREKSLLKAIERATRQPIEPLILPSIQAVNDVRIAKFKSQIGEVLALGGLEQFRSIIEEYEAENNVPAIEIAAALAKMARGNVPLLIEKNQRETSPAAWSDERSSSAGKFDRHERGERSERPERFERSERPERAERSERPAAPRKERGDRAPDVGMQTFRIEVGHTHGVKPGNIVGAIVNEAGIDSKNIGRIEIFDNYSVLDLPASMPAEQFEHLKTVWVAGQQLRISRDGTTPETASKSVATTTAFSSDKPRDSFAAPAERFERRDRPESHEPVARSEAPKRDRNDRKPDAGMERFRIEVGNEHGVKAGNIVGAIANEASLDSKHIGRIEIFDDHSTLDLPEGMPKELLEHLKTVWVAGQQLRISHAGGERSPVADKSSGISKSFASPKSGGDRRVGEKQSDKPPFKNKNDFNNRTDAAKKAKPHRKGPKPT
ncbi:DEAD/DEAH box helicase [Glaciimonas immobilis]|uniref:ATP-dependent RNA helicase DeaD n=1 Tax=Glaciimonas immobilis TaxID=728004 RepID=A0A840RYJ7_9BURK|nr:DEAD/DEAH box helicase [Glaciimonas immobilis]KAF3996278.1 DEAD/DEAH box helicase [Glaciimonas immobilis]MBB5202302.1 ATP-dependent RNA helicase DeaD [Glaciimonas immobilis]